MITEDKPTSEERHGVTKQPPDTCPLIDEAIKEVNAIFRNIRGYERAEEAELRDMVSDVESRLSYLCGYSNSGLMEDIRKRTIEIREWGKEWKELAKQHEPDVGE